MTGNLWLDWVILSLSLFNTILLVWLGLTVLLSAERRGWGVWLAGIGLLVGAGFFISHTALVSQPLFPFSPATDFWWHAGWGPVILAPFSWYVVVLWYAGFWDAPVTALYRRHRPFVLLVLLAAAALAGLLLFANPLPSLQGYDQAPPRPVLSFGGQPLLILAYPAYILLCVLLSQDALLRPAPSGRFMGDQARRRARPFLVATSLALMAVSLLVAWVMLWLYNRLSAGLFADPAVIIRLGWFDLVIAALIGACILLIGQAVVSYEIFTGRTMPRRGFTRQWQNTIILAAYVACVAAASLVFQARPVYTLLLALVLMTVFYALFSWRAGAEREQLTAALRPFVSSQRVFEGLLEGEAGGPGKLEDLFAALCRQVLTAERACLVPLGPLAPLAGPPLAYPPGAELSLPDLAALSARFASPRIFALPLNEDPAVGLAWAVPLWSERGLIGVLLLGEKSGGGFYTEEEIEIARASGERLVDNGASAEIARRLMAVQRQRLAESQVLDRQTRRVLHDEVLPALHAALLQLSSAGQGSGEAVETLSQVHRQISNLLHDLPPSSPPQLARLGLAAALRQMAEDEYGQSFDEVRWQQDEAAGPHLAGLGPLPAGVLYFAAREAVRNAARHARRGSPDRPLVLSLSVAWDAGLRIVIEDNGSGVSETAAPDQPAGQGLALHSTMMAVAGGTLALESRPGVFTRVTLTLPE